MNKQDITRSLIALSIEQGIKDMKINSHRSIRRLADLGRQFSKGRFQDQTFALFQRMLSDESSPYYDMIDTFLANTDQAYIRHFGIDVGYNGWTYGASLLRKEEAQTGQRFPWLLQLSWNPSSALTLQDLTALVTKNRENGTYCYSIRIKESLRDDLTLFSLFSAHDDCAFLLNLADTDCALTSEQQDAVSHCPNLMVVLPEESPNCRALAQSLSTQHSLFAISHRYREEEAVSLTAPDRIAGLLSYGSVFLLFSADDDCSPEAQKKAGDSILEARLEQKYPALLLDMDSDIERVNQIIYR